MQVFVLVFLSLASLLCVVSSTSNLWDYCIIGAGPSGLQMGWQLKKAGRNYIVFEKGNSSGNFFTQFPRHDRLISINKRHTGQTNKEFNLRHDWNSILSDDESLLFKEYSKVFLPPRETFVDYLKDYEHKLGINVQHNTLIENVKRVICEATGDHVYTMNDQHGNSYTCKTTIMATGLWKPNQPTFQGVEHTVGYEDMSLDPDDYEGKTVLILGRGNSAFETAEHIYGATNLIHMLGRTRVRLSWATHYVGDLRAVNNALLDTYQLKSLDGVLETPIEQMKIIKKGDKLYAFPLEVETNSDNYDNYAMREAYDVVIRCLGFHFDHSIFHNMSMPKFGKGRKKKYPLINHNYESADMSGLFFAGTLGHSLDYRKSAGGFIHGFRYTNRALHRHLEWKNHQVQWPSVTLPTTELMNTFIKRMNEGSGIYQMFQMLGDVAFISDDGKSFTYLEEIPINLIHDMQNATGHTANRAIVMVLEYGANFSGPGKDIFRVNRAVGDPAEAYNSNFLHPVLYYYSPLPTDMDMKGRNKYETLPKPRRIHHIVEDFLTHWMSPISHILPLRRFIEYCLEEDMREFYAESCFRYSLTSHTVPRKCENYLQGQGLSGTPELKKFARDIGLLSLGLLKE
ncbi:FAD-dependent oxidoreductase domain-containing protein 2-like [Lineus longissimus]|uniref:FAD-dependent oxidoreductase domain-containing protein 2-like n=1 Tax=Lineus longissimus TaxID=88925 RepID=UPI002B4E8AAA